MMVSSTARTRNPAAVVLEPANALSRSDRQTLYMAIEVLECYQSSYSLRQIEREAAASITVVVNPYFPFHPFDKFRTQI
jgi:hypothetical protein